ncbi:MAG: response regulator transcription factor [Deltaproteobacteria bacterium]|nr:response regulator transcription factor [Deltaproteobacteria bacterium]
MDGKPLTIVACEDDPITIAYIKKAIRLIPNAQVQTYNRLGDAMLAVRREKPQVFICDHHLPGQDGTDGVRLVKGSDWGRDVKVLVYTGADVREKAMAAGADLFLKKPATVDTLINAVRSLVGA